MFSETRRRSAAATSVPAGGSTIVQLADRENTWTPIVLAASLILQTAVLAPLLWRLSQPNSDAAVLEKQVTVLIAEVSKQHERESLLHEKMQVEERQKAMDAILASLQVGPESLTKRLMNAEEKLDEHNTKESMAARAHKQAEREIHQLTSKRDQLQDQLTKRGTDYEALQKKAEEDTAKLKGKVKERDEEVKKLKGLAADEKTAWYQLPAGYGLGLGGLLLGAMVGAVAVWVSRGPGAQPEPVRDERHPRPMGREHTFHDEPPADDGRSSS